MNLTSDLHTPPSCFDSEQAVLGAILFNPSALYECIGTLLPEHFSEPVHQRIYTAILNQHNSGLSPTPLTLRKIFDEDSDLKELDGGRYLTRLADAAIAVINIQDNAASIVENFQRREIINACSDASIEVHRTDNTPEQIAEDLLHKMGAVFNEFSGNSIKTNFQVGQEVLDDMVKNKSPISTGISSLDKAMGGGLHPGKSYGFAARKKVGKTILAGTISYNLNLAGVKHLFICAEMGRKEIHERSMARGLDVHPFSFRGDARNSQKFQQRVAEYIVNQPKNIFYCDSPGISFPKLRQSIMMAIHRHKISGFILDYWQLVGGKPTKKSTAEHLDEVAQWISDFCRKHGLWSVTMAQINQEGNTRGGEGMRLAFDQVYQIHREDVSLPGTWIEMMDTRYTPWVNIGDAHTPGLMMKQNGPFFEVV